MTRQKPVPLPDQYSAEIVRSDGESARVFIDGEMRRTEALVAGARNIVIARPDLGEIYTILPDRGAYMRSRLNQEMLSLLREGEEDEEWEFIGDEALNGEPVRKYRAYVAGSPSPDRIVFIQPHTGIRLRTVTLNRNGAEVLTVDTRNVVIGAPPKALFEVPGGLKQIG
jgi:hypothetical protein